jgi:hypothetical protein
MISEAALLASLSSAYGFPIPPLFAKFIHCTVQLRAKPEYQSISDEWDLIAFLVNGYVGRVLLKTSDSGRYFHTPPELFPFGSNGADGIHYGFVVHAPELEQSDYPIGEFAPMDDTGVTLIGNTTKTALECLLSEALEIEESGKRSLIDELAQTLDLSTAPEKVREDYTTPIQLYIPSGWYFEPSGDGIGVLAPSSFWSPNTPTIETWEFETIERGIERPDVDRAIEEVQRAFYDEYPATALFILRELYWRDPGLDLLEMIAPWWQRAYEELNRSCLAEAIRQQLTEQRTLQAQWKEQQVSYYTEVELIGYTIDEDEFTEFESDETLEDDDR